MKKFTRMLIAAGALTMSAGAMAAAAPEPTWLPATAAASLQNASAIVEGGSAHNRCGGKPRSPQPAALS